MKLYVLTFEPYYENSTVLGVYTDRALATRALEDAPKGKPEPNWDDGDTYDLREFEADTQTLTAHWCNSNPHDPEPVRVPASERHPKGLTFRKLGWRVEEMPLLTVLPEGGAGCG
jgi:hypothetical protein